MWPLMPAPRRRPKNALHYDESGSFLLTRQMSRLHVIIRYCRGKRNLMTLNRRRLFQYAALTGGYSTAAKGAEPAITLAILRDVSTLHGANLTDDRLRVLRPVLGQVLSRWRELRAFEVPPTTAPTQGTLD